jgi:transposase-like protein
MRPTSRSASASARAAGRLEHNTRQPPGAALPIWSLPIAKLHPSWRWLEKNIPEGLTVFSLPDHHRRRMRTSNPMERAVQQELKRRTQKVRVFPNEASLDRLVSAVLVEIDDKWAADTKAYIKWECQDA